MLWLLPWEDEDDVRHMPWCTWSLIALNVLVFLAMLGGTTVDVPRWFDDYGLIAGDWRWYQFITSSFMHAGLLHLLGNMFFLWVFGDNVEDALGRAGFLVVYFLGGFAGDLLFVQANDHLLPSVGASGCIAALAGAYGVLFYDRDIDLKLIFIVVPVHTFHVGAFWVLLYWFGMDVARTLVGGGALDAGEAVNYVAHGGGFLFGFVVAVIALIAGVMRRYRAVDNGDGWWGYWPLDLEDRARRQRAREMQRERQRHARSGKG